MPAHRSRIDKLPIRVGPISSFSCQAVPLDETMASHQATSSSPSDPAHDSPAAGFSADRASPASAAGSGNNKAHLSEEQKKANHIASEKKRRNNIREQYDNLAAMVPGMTGQGRSEGRVLEETVKYSLRLAQERMDMIHQLRDAGQHVDAQLETEVLNAINHLKSKQAHGEMMDSGSSNNSNLQHYDSTQRQGR